MWPVLTRDNLHLSRPKMAVLTPTGKVTLNCRNPPKEDNIDRGDGLPERVSDYVRGSVSANTRRAYRSDLMHFQEWGGAIPATEEMIAAYLADHAGELSVATLMRRLASIAKAHAAQGLGNPTSSILVQSTLKGIKRAYTTLQRQAKPLLVADLLTIMASLTDSAKDMRDKALLLIGFAGGFRRSELVAIDYGDIEWVQQGVVVLIRRSKTDQEGAGRKIGIPYARGRYCPVISLKAWLAHVCAEDGPVFRPVDRHGRISKARLSGEAVSLVIKDRVSAIGLEPDEYSGHSLRAGFATSAATAGVSSCKIRQQTGHASDAMLARYIRDGELFVDNAAGALL